MIYQNSNFKYFEFLFYQDQNYLYLIIIMIIKITIVNLTNFIIIMLIIIVIIIPNSNILKKIVFKKFPINLFILEYLTFLHLIIIQNFQIYFVFSVVFKVVNNSIVVIVIIIRYIVDLINLKLYFITIIMMDYITTMQINLLFAKFPFLNLILFMKKTNLKN